MKREAMLFGAITVALVLAARATPPPDDWLIAEDGVLETASAALFLLAAWLAAAGLARAPEGAHRALWVVAPLALLGFLDEISFGARLFGWTMPALEGGGEFDGAHDVAIVLHRRASAFFAARPAVAVTVALAAAATALAVLWAVRRPVWRLADAVAADGVWRRLAIAGAFLAAAVGLDLDLAPVHGARHAEEWSEFATAFWLAAAARAGARRPASVSGIPGAAPHGGAPTALGMAPDREARTSGR
jgi:hypothetical protein